MKIGILALQGAVEPHEAKLKALNAIPIQVRHSSDLEDLHGIILPGGESTSMVHLLKLNELWESLREFTSRKPTWGVCAGAILLARHVTHPNQESLGRMDIEIERNAYGRQKESFIAALTPSDSWMDRDALEGVFIRAPRIAKVGETCRTLIRYQGEGVMVEQDSLLVTTFHPELTTSDKIHQYFLEKCVP